MKPSVIMRTMVRDGFQVNIGGLVEDVVPVSVLREELNELIRDVWADHFLTYPQKGDTEKKIRKRFACVLKEEGN